jgi:small subunit ribosomal protein S1
MDTSQKESVETQDVQQRDESYWSSLFALEPSVIDDTPPQDGQPQIEPAADVEQEGPFFADAASFIPDPWQLAENLMATDQVLELTVMGHNAGGLLVLWRGIQGFVPASQLIDFPQFHVPRERQRALSEWHGRSLKLKIIEINRAKSRLIFSERASLVAAVVREDLLGKLSEGDIVEGRVSNLTQFGAFVDLGGVEGLIHISEISWARITDPSSVLQPNQVVQVQVMGVDRSAGRVALSLKKLRPDPWATAGERYKPEQLVRGVVGNVATFGAVVILEEQLEGLVHISELAEGVFLHPRDVVRQGDEVVARVLYVDAPNKRLALSMRGIQGVVEPGQ